MIFLEFSQSDGLHESNRLEQYFSIQQQIHVMLNECSIDQPLIR